MKHISNIFLGFALFFLSPVNKMDAQNNQEKRLQIVYIDHEVTTPTDVLNQRMTERFWNAKEFPDGEALILYLSNGRKSPQAFVNLKEFMTERQLEVFTTSSTPRDTEEAFMAVLEAMNTANSHTVEAQMDVDYILQILERFDVFDENGRLNFKSLRFDFYVGPNFWLMNNNEKVIARLYAVILQGLPEDEKEKISFRVLKPSGCQLEYSDGKPFGEANLEGINEQLSNR